MDIQPTIPDHTTEGCGRESSVPSERSWVLHWGEQSLDEEGLQTFFCECEAILNSRPITTPSNDMNDLEALSPQHLLLLKTQPNLPPGLFQKDDTYARKRWRQIQYMSDLFWKRWTKEYLPQLQTRQKWNHPSRNFIPGDVVLIVDESAPRGSWLMGRIVKTMEEEHGLVRKVRVKTKTNELERPITKLCLLQEAVWEVLLLTWVLLRREKIF